MMGASHLIHGVAASTAQRDPEQLDHAIGQLLCRFLAARSLALYHLLREEDGSSRTAHRIELTAEGVRTDTLTGLLNRKTFESHFEKMRRRNGARERAGDRPGRSHEPGWLALADIDHFKSINDSHGHLFGDEVLLIVSQILKRSFRGADQLFRFGGEEFLIVLDHASESGAQVALERFRAAIEAHVFPQIRRVTVSLGYTRILPHDVPTICAERADGALYYAKRNGRNKLCNYEALVSAGDLKTTSNVTDVELF